MTTATETLTQLEELWENAEPGPFNEGDTVIYRLPRPGGEPDWFELRVATSLAGEHYRARVIERAKPKAPEWEAVVASWIEDEEHRRQVFTRNDWGKWESIHWYTDADGLVDPVPLVELPEREALARAIASGLGEGPGNFHLIPADAVLELLRGER